MCSDIVGAGLMGAVVGKNFSDTLEILTDKSGERIRAQAAQDEAQAASESKKSEQGHEVMMAMAIAVKQARDETQGWRGYAGRLRMHINAHKMSENALLDALKAENINHPLATEEGFKEHFRVELAKQYADIDDSDEAGDEQGRRLDDDQERSFSLPREQGRIEVGDDIGRPYPKVAKDGDKVG